jgi:pyruvate-ferredoxin/flavodoxin oxidoreductase
MFGERMVVANATGCSSIWGGSAPSNPYTVNPLTGRGPAWANSLFEDNAQFGLGISMGLKQRRASYAAAVRSLLADKEGPGSAELRSAFGEWLQVWRGFWALGACTVPDPFGALYVSCRDTQLLMRLNWHFV